MKIKYSRIHISGNANNKTKFAKEAWHEFYMFFIYLIILSPITDVFI